MLWKVWDIRVFGSLTSDGITTADVTVIPHTLGWQYVLSRAGGLFMNFPMSPDSCPLESLSTWMNFQALSPDPLTADDLSGDRSENIWTVAVPITLFPEDIAIWVTTDMSLTRDTFIKNRCEEDSILFTTHSAVCKVLKDTLKEKDISLSGYEEYGDLMLRSAVVFFDTDFWESWPGGLSEHESFSETVRNFIRKRKAPGERIFVR